MGGVSKLQAKFRRPFEASFEDLSKQVSKHLSKQVSKGKTVKLKAGLDSNPIGTCRSKCTNQVSKQVSKGPPEVSKGVRNLSARCSKLIGRCPTQSETYRKVPRDSPESPDSRRASTTPDRPEHVPRAGRISFEPVSKEVV